MPEKNTRWIRPLPERLVNKIAAGEVIERPSAVLKELVENAIDAGSTQIDIVIEKSGTKSIIVVDNGCGISSEQVEIAFARHATSKISDFDDLENLLTFGFRGEALPSIGSVSKTRMVTKSKEEETGTEIIIEGGVLQSVKPVSAPNGTRIEVTDLFFNTPARRKFLKAESTEARHLNRNSVAMALGAFGVGMSYQINGRKMYQVNAGEDMHARIANLLMHGDKENLFEIASESAIMNVSGFLSFPEKIRQNKNGLFFFVNGRYISSMTILHAVTSGYREMLPRGRYPIGAVFMNVDPLKVDVNVHPTKAEVRLSEERAMHDMLYQTVKRSLRESGRIASFGVTGTASAPSDLPQMTAGEAIERLRDKGPKIEYEKIQTDMTALYEPMQKTESVEIGPSPSRTETVSEADVNIANPIYLGQLANLYLIFKVYDQILIIDQHTAHERVLFEENLKSMSEGRAISQNLLFPINIELPADQYALFEEAKAVLTEVGFTVEPFGGSTVIINAVPISLSKKSPEKIFSEILADVEELKLTGYDLKKAVAQSMACRSAVMAGDRLTEEEAVGLVKRLNGCSNKYSCPHGRPTILKIDKNELDVRFGRK